MSKLLRCNKKKIKLNKNIYKKKKITILSSIFDVYPRKKSLDMHKQTQESM